MQTTSLTAEQRDAYERDGHIVLPAVFAPDEIAEMRDASDRLVELTINASLALGEKDPRLDLQRRDGRAVVRKIQPVIDASEVLARYSNDERLLGPMRDLLGCEPLLMEEKLNPKHPLPSDVPIECGSSGEVFLPHTDYAFFAVDGYPRETLSSALTLDDCTPDNGPITVLPGSHTRDWPLRDGFPPVLADGAVSDDDLIPVLAPAGSVVLFHSCLVHSSSENRTDAPRRLMIYSHYPSTHSTEPDRKNRALRERAQDFEHRAAERPDPGFRLA